MSKEEGRDCLGAVFPGKGKVELLVSPNLAQPSAGPGAFPTPPVPAGKVSIAEMFACERAWMELLVLLKIPVIPFLTWLS